MSEVVERYLRLGLQIGRHVDGMVYAYFGPPALAAAVDAESPVEPRALRRAANSERMFLLDFDRYKRSPPA